jgi:hypothetical protein
MERRDSSPREKMREGGGIGCVSKGGLSTSIYRPLQGFFSLSFYCFPHATWLV